MATQSSSTPSRSLSMDTKVSANSSKPSIGRNIEQPLVGKVGSGMQSMPGSKGKGQAVSTVKSNPISGPNNVQKGNTSMGNGGVISGMV